MTWWDAAFLAAAGVVGGLTGSIAGLASIATYPALLLVGLPPVTANVTNTVALVFNGDRLGVGLTAGTDGPRTLAEANTSGNRGGGRGRGRAVAVDACGGLREDRADPARNCVDRYRHSASATPSGGTGRRSSWPHRQHALESIAIFLICIYGGYFGAAAGVLLLALLLRAGHATLAHANASKNVILGVANAVAALIFSLFAPVHWPAVVALGLGCLVGSRLGPVIVRHAPPGPLKVLIGAAGVALAVKLGIDAYS